MLKKGRLFFTRDYYTANRISNDLPIANGESPGTVDASDKGCHRFLDTPRKKLDQSWDLIPQCLD